MVTAFCLLHHNVARIAPLPTLFLRLLQESLCFFILGAVQGRMPFTITGNANFGLAAAAVRNLPVAHLLDTRGLDPFAAFLGWAVKAVLSGKLFILSIPRLLE